MARHDRIISPPQTDVSASSGDMVGKQPKPNRKTGRKRVVQGALAVIAVVVVGWFGVQYWTTGRFMVKTDDAYVTADITLISSRVQGYVSEISVSENDPVTKGEALVRLDDGDYRIALQTAKSRVSTVGETLTRIKAQIEAAQAGVAQSQAMRNVARAQLRSAQTNADRIGKLARDNIVSQSKLDAATEGLDTAIASVANADASVSSAQAQVAVLNAQRAETQGLKHELELAVAQAKRNLDLTVLRAPADGTLANLAVEVGDLVAPGARLAAVVPQGSFYIEANFKETQMGGIALGADVSVTFDALAGQVFKGRVTSVAPATGSVFSLLPADNATGNFTKVVQRVPVRIAIAKPAIATGKLRAGLSAVVQVDSRTGADVAPTAIAAAE